MQLIDPVGGLPVASVTVPGEGTWTVVSGQVRFTPVAGFTGDADLDYQVTNTAGQTVTATMTVTYPPPLSVIATPPVLPATPPSVPAAVTPDRPTTLLVTVRLPGSRGSSAGLATTGADPMSSLLVAFLLVGAGVALARARRRLTPRA